MFLDSGIARITSQVCLSFLWRKSEKIPSKSSVLRNDLSGDMHFVYITSCEGRPRVVLNTLKFKSSALLLLLLLKQCTDVRALSFAHPQNFCNFRSKAYSLVYLHSACNHFPPTLHRTENTQKRKQNVQAVRKLTSYVMRSVQNNNCWLPRFDDFP